MSDRPRFVVDTNVMVDAALFEESHGFRAYVLALHTGPVMASKATFSEFEEVLMRPRFDRYLGREERQMFLALLKRDISWIEPWFHYQVCRDPSDDKFVDVAVCSGAAAIITRDADLLSLGSFNGIRIEDARTFVLRQPQLEA